MSGDDSGIYKQLIRDLVVNGPRARELCGGPAHFDVFRLCSLAWIDNPETPWGDAGELGCLPGVATSIPTARPPSPVEVPQELLQHLAPVTSTELGQGLQFIANSGEANGPGSTAFRSGAKTS